MAFKEKLSSIFGGADASSASTSVESAPSTPSLDALQSELKGGRKRQSKAERLAGEVKAEQELNDLLDRLYQRENWEDIAALYFRCRFAFTGFDGFLLTEKEKVRLGESLAMMMRILLRIDPPYVAIIVFSVTFSTTVVTKEMAYRAMVQQLQSGKIRHPRMPGGFPGQPGAA